MEAADAFDVMAAMRAMRRLRPDPVPDEMVNRLVRADRPLLRLPSPGRVPAVGA